MTCTDQDKPLCSDPVHFRFKGKRDYVHGTDMYQEVSHRLQNESDNAIDSFRITFHGRNHHHCNFVLYPLPGGVSRPEPIAAEFTAKLDGHPVIGWLIPGDTAVVDRYPYDESGILEQVKVSGEQAVLNVDPGFSSIETVVAVNRQMHELLYSGTRGKWVFSRLDLRQLLPPTPVLPVSIQLKQNIGNRLTRSQIYFGPDQVGDIYFSLTS